MKRDPNYENVFQNVEQIYFTAVEKTIPTPSKEQE